MSSERDKIRRTVETWNDVMHILEDYETIYGHGQWDKLTDNEKRIIDSYTQNTLGQMNSLINAKGLEKLEHTEYDHLVNTFASLFMQSTTLIPLEFEYDEFPTLNQDGDTYYRHYILVGKDGHFTRIFMTVAVEPDTKLRTVNFILKAKWKNGSLRDFLIEDSIEELINVLENNNEIYWEMDK